MEKHLLTLPPGWRSKSFGKFVSWNWTLVRMLATSGVFEIAETDLPKINLPGVRNANWCVLGVNGKLVGLDTWDSADPLKAYLESEDTACRAAISTLSLIVKIQYFSNPYWDRLRIQCPVPLTSWTIFPTHDFPLGFFTYDADKAHKYLATTTGKNGRFGRQQWIEAGRQIGGFRTKNDFNDKDDRHEFLDILTQCRWGLCLKGAWCAPKNRREVEYSSCAMPLALNYMPSYPFDFAPNEHYLYLEKPQDLITLRDVNPEPYAKASKHIYDNHFSPAGMAKSLIKLVTEKAL